MKRLGAFAIAVLIAASASAATTLSVNRRTVLPGDMVTITLVLDGPFSGIEDVELPVENLEVAGRPSMTTGFLFGTREGTTRRRMLNFYARAIAPGPASVGPLVLRENGAEIQLPQIVIQVEDNRIGTPNTPAALLRERLAAGRDPYFIVTDANKTDVFVGEQIIVKWTLYNAASVHDWRIGAIPKLPDFWTEELPYRDGDPKAVLVSGVGMRAVPVRGVALFPLRSGTHAIGGLTVNAQVMHGRRRGVFGQFEGQIIDSSYSSAPLTINVKPLPPGPPVGAVGNYTLGCGEPSQRDNGPVVIDVTLQGEGNVRAASEPRLAKAIDGRLEIEQGRVGVSMLGDAVRMSRQWQYLIFPRQRGMFEIPPIVLSVFDPTTVERRELRCVERALFVADAAVPDAAPVEVTRPARSWWPISLGLALAAVAIVFSLVLWRRHRAVRREARALIDGLSAAELREVVDARIEERGLDPKVLVVEQTDRGDAYRAVRSLADGMERERFAAETAEVERRVRELLATIAR